MTYRIRHLTCGVCAYRQRLKIRLAGDTEVVPTCVACGASAWLALPTLRAPEPVCPGTGYGGICPCGWRAIADGQSPPGLTGGHDFWAFLHRNLNPGAFE